MGSTHVQCTLDYIYLSSRVDTEYLGQWVIPMSITPSEMVKIQLPQLRIDIVQRQAQHLGLTLVGVPMHRASSEPFVNRIGRALELLQKAYGKKVAGQNIGEKITGSHVI